METQTNSLLLTLKEGTAELHHAAEQIPFAKALMGGTLPLAAYKQYLAQRLIFHAALDAAWGRILQSHPEWSTAIKPEHMQMQYLNADAAYFHIDAAQVTPTAGTARALAMIAEAEAIAPAKLIGHLYVHEGSKNGGMFLSRAIRGTLSLPEGQGTSYLEPYGKAQRETWAAFKETIDAMEWSDAEREQILEGAKDGFRAVTEIDAEIPVTA